jgi:hypothetical protein
MNIDGLFEPDESEEDSNDEGGGDGANVNLEYLEQIFAEISKNGQTVSYSQFRNWDEIKHMFSESVLDEVELETMWYVIHAILLYV